MIVVQILGGLGNQMFQYAAAKALALRRGDTLKLDLRPFRHYGLRRYALDCFALPDPPATDAEVFALTGRPVNRLQSVRWRLRRLLRRPAAAAVYAEPHFHFDPGLERAPRDVYLEGYWQSPRYFQDQAAAVRELFELPHPPEGRNAELAALAQETASVALHVRRGDYVSDARTRDVHGPCSLDYYGRAMRLVEERLGGEEPHYLVFSDDMDWARAHLPGGRRMVFADHNGPDHAHEDLRLMRLCRHAVVANSSLSWWGAWLHPDPDRLVVAPVPWFDDPDKDHRDLLPPHWHTLPKHPES